MKQLSLGLLMAIVSLPACSQPEKSKPQSKPITVSNNTLLWKISGNGLEKPSYLYGTIHMICGSDAILSDSLKKAISKCDEVYLEVDMDNIFEMLGAISALKMKGDTTLADLYTEEEFERVKKYFTENSSMIPFNMLQSFKPMLASGLLEQKGMQCEGAVAIEQVIMGEANEYKKPIKGLETLKYQAGVLDSIPYKMQAMQLLSYIDSSNAGADNKEMDAMMDAYKTQNLEKLEELMMKSEPGMMVYYDILLFHRNRNWVTKLKDLLPKKSMVIAVGAGHLPGEKGVINLLKKEGYKVTPVENKIVKTKVI
jgi:uncharacterized protein YbaP (TraB family)